MAYLNGNQLLINAHVICDTDASYLAGQKSMAVLGTATGAPAVCDYVHPTEHQMKVNLETKNLFDISNFVGSRGCTVEDNVLMITPITTYFTAQYVLPKTLVGETITVSTDVVNTSNNEAQIYLRWLVASTGVQVGLGTVNIASQKSGQLKLTATIPPPPDDTAVLQVLFYACTSSKDETDSIKYANIQVERGATATTYSPYTTDFSDFKVLQAEGDGGEYPANADGSVPGVKSVSPSSLLYVEPEGALVTVEYWLDTERKLADMETALLDLGGSL